MNPEQAKKDLEVLGNLLHAPSSQNPTSPADLSGDSTEASGVSTVPGAASPSAPVILLPTALRSETVTRRKAVPGFSGVCALLESEGHQVCIVCADQGVLLHLIADLMPAIDLTTVRPQAVTIIQAQ